MAHTAHVIATGKARVVNSGGRPSARVEEKIAANMDLLAATSDMEREIEILLKAEGHELKICQHLERELCESVCRTRAIHDRLVILRADRRRENAALCRGEHIA